MSRISIRLRVALWCAGLLVVAGTIVLVGVTTVTARILHDRANPAALAPPVPAPAQLPGAPPPAQSKQAADHQGNVVNSTLAETRDVGLGVLGALALASVGIGWLVAGRMLAPVRQLAAAAHDVSATSLDRRIKRGGPADELQELADSFDAMLDRLERAFEAQRRFVADASHELRTPLATIRAEIESVLDDPDVTTGDAREASTRIAGVLDRAEALIEALLTLSRSDGLHVQEPVDLAELARDLVTSTPGASRLDIRLELDPAPVEGDPALLERLLANLIENAVRYNDSGGLLAVSTGTSGGQAVAHVVNDGPVIPEADVPSLVARFQRLQRVGRGFGLGLAIADAIANSHGGILTLRARPEGGLDATIALPRAV